MSGIVQNRIRRYLQVVIGDLKGKYFIIKYKNQDLQESLGYPVLEGIDYLSVLDEDSSCMEQAFFIFMNDIELDHEGNVFDTIIEQIKKTAQKILHFVFHSRTKQRQNLKSVVLWCTKLCKISNLLNHSLIINLLIKWSDTNVFFFTRRIKKDCSNM